ncbi:MAG: hypothetical protein KAI66_01390 [Lentisphaeria bacterium]|nr:hypothetical protein [Lentisphaeria bacterium]
MKVPSASFSASVRRLLFATCVVAGVCMAVSILAQETPFSLDSDEFPIGMFSVDGDGGMAQVAKMGVRYVHTYANGRSATPEGIAKDRSYLDMAQKHGLKVMFNLRGIKWMKTENGLAEMMKLVDAFKDHPALGFWYFCDEPDGVHKPADLIPYYHALKKATPHIPVMIAMAWTKKWYAFNDSLDVLMIDNYPVQHRPFPTSKLSVMTKFTDGALRLGKPVIPINQCMNWRVLAGDRKEFRGSPVSEMRFPNDVEIRYWCFSGATQGVRGMFWWSYARSVQAGYGWINGEFARTMREFDTFTKLVAPAHKPVIFKRSRDANIMMALWRRENVDVLVAVNAWPLEQPMTRWTEDILAKATLTPWGSTRDTNATIQNGALKAGIAKPWEVFVWTLTDIE